MVARDNVREMTSLLQVASHELRSPLSAVKGYASALLTYYDQLDEEEIRQYIEGIDNAAHQMEMLVADLLTYSSMASGAHQLNLIEVALSSFLQNVVESRRITAPAQEYKLSLRSLDPHVSVDPVRLRQVLDNLLDNATQHGEGPITVSVSSRRDMAVVKITNQGLGVPSESLEKIFEPFVRVRTLAKRQVQSTGLGLSVCRGIVETHGGEIWAERPSRGGFRITFTLPLRKSKGR
jgi:signal transduction histidine kinase